MLLLIMFVQPRHVLFLFGSCVLLAASGGVSALLGAPSAGGEAAEAGAQKPQGQQPLASKSPGNSDIISISDPRY
jgi:hypothetical protein